MATLLVPQLCPLHFHWRNTGLFTLNDEKWHIQLKSVLCKRSRSKSYNLNYGVLTENIHFSKINASRTVKIEHREKACARRPPPYWERPVSAVQGSARTPPTATHQSHPVRTPVAHCHLALHTNRIHSLQPICVQKWTVLVCINTLLLTLTLCTIRKYTFRKYTYNLTFFPNCTTKQQSSFY